MSTSEDDRKPEEPAEEKATPPPPADPNATVAITPEQIEEMKAASAPPPPTDPAATVAITPEQIEEMKAASEPPAPESQATVAITPEQIQHLKEAAEQAAADDATEDPDEDPLVGTLLRNKWKVLKRLGAGSFGTVYKVQDVKGGWVEALKILGVDRLTGGEAENARKRFLREAQIMKRLGTESPHIVGLSTYEEDLEAGLIYFLMEMVEGRSLADVLAEEGPFSVERTVRLAMQVCDALTVAHEGPEAVVHRDLKLENLMLTKDRAGQEIIKVLDFGIAKLAEREADSRLTTVGTLGTPGYAAPEQLRAENVDARTDLFAFGVILYSLLTGLDPWLGNPASEPTTQIYELMVATDRGEVRPMAQTGVSVPPAMEQIVLKLLRRNPDERFASARELKEALQRVAQGGADTTLASLRVVTDEPGVLVQVRAGRKTVAEGPTPCLANALDPGTYRVVIRDDRYEPTETTVELGPGALQDITVVTQPRAGGLSATLRRRLGAVAAVVVLAALGAGTAVVRPWGRTLTLEEVLGRASAGAVSEVRLTPTGLDGRLAVGPLPAPFHVPLEEADALDAVSRLRDAGLTVDASWEIRRLIRRAAEAQAHMRYFGEEGADVVTFATQAARLDPESPEAQALLSKAGERMAWDAEAALADGAPDRAEALVRRCLELVPEHPRCSAVQVGG